MIFSAIARRRTWIALAISVAFALIAFRADSAVSLLGSGSSFIEPLYDQYFPQLAQDKDIQVRYLTVGSGPAFRRLGNKVTNFASSDFNPKGEAAQILLRLDQRPDLEMIRVPVATGGIAIIYNLSSTADQGTSTADLRISRQKLADIFTGKITNWQQISPSLPNQDIKVVVRCEVAGPNYIFSRHLNSITNGEVGVFPGPKWWQEAGLQPFAARQLDSGVTAAVALTDGAIGYVQVNYALEKGLPTARIQNAAGQFIEPTLDEIESATANLQYDDEFELVGMEDPQEGYPLVGLNSIFMYKQQDNPEKMEGLKGMVEWILTEGQSLNREYGYLPIPNDVAQRAIASLSALRLEPWPYIEMSGEVESPTLEACR